MIRWGGGLAALGLAFAFAIGMSAHPGGSAVTWNASAGSIVERRCATCHAAEGPARPRLDRYEFARAAGPAIKAAVLAQHAPGWQALPGAVGFRNDPRPTPYERELLAQWADARAPLGEGERAIEAAIEPSSQYVVLAVPGKHRIDGPSATFTLATGFATERWIRGWRFEPGNVERVVAATWSLTSGRTLGTWSAGEQGTKLPDGVGIRLPPRAMLRLTVFYRSSVAAAVDASRLRLDFASADSRPLETMRLACGAATPPQAAHAIAVRPMGRARRLTITTRQGAAVQPLVRFHETSVPRTYWFDAPVPLGDSIVTVESTGDCHVELDYVHGAVPAWGGSRVRPADAEGYVCPMHPDVRRARSGDCERCGMRLVPSGGAVTSFYGMSAAFVPGARNDGRIRVRVTDETGAEVRAFDTVHDRAFHLFAVSEDLSEFAHLHPEARLDGTLECAFSPEGGGTFRIFGDFLPSGGTPQLFARTLTIARPRSRPRAAALEPDLAPKVEGDLRVELITDAGLRAGEPSLLTFRLTQADTGAPFEGLEPLLGAWSHAFIASADLADAVHSHPAAPLSASPGATVVFTQRFPRAGLYRVWAQFKRGGRVATLPFTLRVS